MFPNLDYKDLLDFIKFRAEMLGMSIRVGTHSLRKGGAEALAADSQLYVLLAAGGWSSNAFRAYIDMQRQYYLAHQRCIRKTGQVLSDEENSDDED